MQVENATHKLQLDTSLFYWNGSLDQYATLEELHRPGFKPWVWAQLSRVIDAGFVLTVKCDPFEEKAHIHRGEFSCYINLDSMPSEILDKMRTKDIEVWHPDPDKNGNCFMMGYYHNIQSSRNSVIFG